MLKEHVLHGMRCFIAHVFVPDVDWGMMMHAGRAQRCFCVRCALSRCSHGGLNRNGARVARPGPAAAGGAEMVVSYKE